MDSNLDFWGIHTHTCMYILMQTYFTNMCKHTALSLPLHTHICIWKGPAKVGKEDWDRKAMFKINTTWKNTVTVSLIKGITNKFLKGDCWTSLHQTEDKEQYGHFVPANTTADKAALHTAHRTSWSTPAVEIRRGLCPPSHPSSGPHTTRVLAH